MSEAQVLLFDEYEEASEKKKWSAIGWERIGSPVLPRWYPSSGCTVDRITAAFRYGGHDRGDDFSCICSARIRSAGVPGDAAPCLF